MDIRYSKDAVKALKSCDQQTRQRIRSGIAGLTKQPPDGDIKPLRGAKGNYRLRVGDYRILFSYPESDTVMVKKISPRGDAYKGA